MSRGIDNDGRLGTPAGIPAGHVDEWGESVVDYLDGRLAPETRIVVEVHLEGCPACAARVLTQQSVIRLLQGTSLADPPEGLEHRVLGELLFPSGPVSRRKVAERPRGWRGSILWRRKIRPWIPATVAVAALLATVVGIGLLRSDTDVLTANREEATSTLAAKDQTGEGSPAPFESLGAATSVAAATTTLAGATTTLAASEPMVPAVTQDRKQMVSSLKVAQVPAYLAFEAPAPPLPEDVQSEEPVTTVPGDASRSGGAMTVSQEQVKAVVSSMLEFTGMQPLDETLALGGPTFAAFVPRDDASQLVDLVRSIGASLGLVVSLGMNPPAGTEEAASRLVERKAEFPVLSAERNPQPAVSGYRFTTSTLTAAGDQNDGTSLTLPDETGTYVLIVFYVRR